MNQTRPPIPLTQSHNPATEEWNDSLLGDYLWTNTNFGEALPDVMTPITWSMMQVYFRANRLDIETAHMPMAGNIGGRAYMNLSMVASLFLGLGFSDERIRALTADTFGRIPEDMEIPIVPFTRWEALRKFVPFAFRRARLIGGLKKEVPGFIAQTPQKAERLAQKISAAQTPQALLTLWETALAPVLEHTMLMLAAGTSDYKSMSRKLRGQLTKMVGDADTNALLSGITLDDHLASDAHIASLGPLIGLTQVARGTLSRAAYLRQCGHRGASELELSLPTFAEDAALFERQIAEVARNETDAAQLLVNKRRQHAEAWVRFTEKYPRKAKKMRQNLEKLDKAAKLREAARSEVVRMIRVYRGYALKVAALTGLGADVFFLTLDETRAVLAGDDGLRLLIPIRKETHARYAALPPYPNVIRGRFDPFAWGADPERGHDRFDSSAPTPPGAGALLQGFAGSPGVIEGAVRVLASSQEGHLLQAGEILVAHTTNVGWTLLFPRAAAIVTDIGAPLSHAAIVARELGIPAVVGTGSATMRLKTGDRVRVHGGEGVVKILSSED